MSQIVYIKAKSEVNLDELNKILARLEIKNDFTTDKHNHDWLRDINENPQSPQRHLKPADRDLKMNELHELFESYTEVGLMDFDVAYSRTSEETAQKYLAFIREYKDCIEYLKGADELPERYETTEEDKNLIQLLNIVPPEPKKLPKDQQTKDDLQGGILLCKSFSPNPFWVIYGKVKDDYPMFMKKRVYEDQDYDGLYRDKQGYGYLLIPLIPVDNRQVEFAEKIYTACWNMGLREAFTYFIPFVYGLDLTDLNSVAKDFRAFYTKEEIRERFMKMFQYASSNYHYNAPGGFCWSDMRKRFVCVGGYEVHTLMSKCSVMTALLRALDPKEAAEIMSDITGTKYLPFEFDMKNPLVKNDKGKAKKI